MTFLLISGIIYSAILVHQKVSSPKTLVTDVVLDQPKGSYIADFRSDTDNICVLVKGGNIADRIICLNSKTKALTTNIKLY